MKRVLTFLLVFTYLLVFSQKKYYILFCEKRDEMIYRKHNNRFIIDGVKIFINKHKYIYFIPSEKKSDYVSNKKPNLKIVTRDELKVIVNDDNPRKDNKFIIIKKNKSIYNYYFMDHIYRTIIN